MDYPTNATALRCLSEEEWDELLTRLEHARLPLPRPVVWLRPPRVVGATPQRVGYHKLDKDQTVQIEDAVRSGASLSAIARDFGVSRQRVHQIKSKMAIRATG